MTRHRGNNPVPILPASEGESSSQGFDNSNNNKSSTPDPVDHLRDLPKRTSVRVACHACRRKRIRLQKCGGQRPSCWQCHQKGEICVYEAEEGETVSLALRRKLSELESENNQYKELYTLLRDTPYAESSEILRRIKSTDNPLDVLGFIRQARLLLPNFDSADSVQDSSSGVENHPSLSSQNNHFSSSGVENYPSASSRENRPGSSGLEDPPSPGREARPGNEGNESTP
ncbi:hypothetical protein ACO1O0_003897 [Amphichorda felina]